MRNMHKVDPQPAIAGFQGQYRWLSNFYIVYVKYDGMTYPSVEHAYQAAKTLDINSRQKIQACPSPGAAKKLGRSVNLRPNWTPLRLAIMKDLLLEKFKQENLRQLLVNTEDAPLIEENWWHDNYWGSCKCDRCGNKGGNWLGILLMQVREEVR